MDMQIKSISDGQLLWLAGFQLTKIQKNGTIKQPVDTEKLAKFCGVSERTVRHWSRYGLPNRARAQIEGLYTGEYLPPAWRNAGIRIQPDGVLLSDGSKVSVEVIQFWKFIVCGVDWERVRGIENAVNAGRRVPLTLLQHGAQAFRELIDLADVKYAAKVKHCLENVEVAQE